MTDPRITELMGLLSSPVPHNRGKRKRMVARIQQLTTALNRQTVRRK